MKFHAKKLENKKGQINKYSKAGIRLSSSLRRSYSLQRAPSSGIFRDCNDNYSRRYTDRGSSYLRANSQAGITRLAAETIERERDRDKRTDERAEDDTFPRTFRDKRILELPARVAFRS